MSRSGYSEDCDGAELAMWRGQVASALRGKRGQKFLRDLIVALDTMPAKRLIAEELQGEDGEVCALGSVCLLRGVEIGKIDDYDYDSIAKVFDVAPQLVQEVEWMNDEAYGLSQPPEKRWERMRAWAVSNIKGGTGEAAA